MNGIVFGYRVLCGCILIRIGYITIDIPVKNHKDFIKRINNGMWPKDRVWIVKYAKLKGD